jgi:putative PIN family toxin of toxin-antitoxin system
MNRERVVFDTNVVVSGLLSNTSRPARVVERVLTHGQLLGSVDTLRELMETLLSPKFDRYLPRTRREALLDRLARNVAIIEIVQQVPSAATPTTIGFLSWR